MNWFMESLEYEDYVMILMFMESLEYEDYVMILMFR